LRSTASLKTNREANPQVAAGHGQAIADPEVDHEAADLAVAASAAVEAVEAEDAGQVRVATRGTSTT